MILDRSRMAGYLDEAGDDPASAIDTLKIHSITNVCLRQLWTGNVLDVSDQAVRKAKALLDESGFKVIMLVTNLGDVPPEELSSVPSEKLDRAFLLASYFGAANIRFRVGRAQTERTGDKAVMAWMESIQSSSIKANIMPLLEPSWDQYVAEPVDIARLLSAFPRWKLLYDPAQLCVQRKIDPFVKYWTLLKSRVGAIDLHDLKIGHNFCPPGQGDCMLGRTLQDATESKYTGWYFMEPGMGRRYGPALTRRDTFALAMEALTLLEEN